MHLEKGMDQEEPPVKSAWLLCVTAHTARCAPIEGDWLCAEDGEREREEKSGPLS